RGEPGQIGYSYLFDGLDAEVDYLTVPNGHLDFGTNSMTISIWANLNETSDYQSLVTKSASSTGYWLRHRADGDRGYFRIGDGTTTETANVWWGNETWVYNVGVADRTNGVLYTYVNGDQHFIDDGATIAGGFGGIDAPAEDFELGDGTYTPEGWLDEVRVSFGARSAGWIKTEYNNQYSPSTFYTVGTEEINKVSWSYRKMITINSSKVTADLTDFPVLVNITDSDLSSKARSDGYDIVFTSADGQTRLYHEIESYTSGTGKLDAWVRIHNLSSSSDTTFYMYYGNSGQSSSTENPESVWDDNYTMVQHLHEISGTHYDSTSNDNDGTEYIDSPGTQDATGMIDGADYFDGSDDYIETTSMAMDGSRTFTAWIKPDFDYDDGLLHTVIEWYNGAQRKFFLAKFSNDDMYLVHDSQDDGGVYLWVIKTIAFSSGEWHHFAGTYDDNAKRLRLYWDGDSLGSTTLSGAVELTGQTTVTIGDGSWGNFNGTIDEVRISNNARSWDWINASYNNQNDISSFLYASSEELIIESWSYRKPITINSSEVTADLTNFPILINITDSDLSSKARSDGYDIVFTSSDGRTRLNHEIESYTSGTGKLDAWVKIQSLSSSSDTIIYMYYGNSGQSSSTENPEGVWDDYYAMVQHLEESPNDDVEGHIDSTSNDNDGTPKNFQDGGDGTTDVTGRIDGADEFGGDDDYVDVAFSSSLNTTNAITVEAWFNSDDALSEESDAWFGGNQKSNCWLLGWHGWDDSWCFGIYDGTGSWTGGTHATDIYVTAGDWVHVVGTFDGRYLKIYVDGQLEDTEDVGSTTIYTTTDGINIGSRGVYWDGKIDEVRISNVARSSDWINTSYNNQNDISSFLYAGSEETVSSSSSSYEWVEIYNAESSSVDLTDWYLEDHQGNTFDLSGAGSIPAGGYLTCHLGESGTNSSTNVYGSVYGTVIQPGTPEGKDNYLDDSAPVINFGTATYLWVENNTNQRRPIIEFNLSSLPQGKVEEAKVYLYRYDGDASNDADVNVHRVTQNWTEADPGGSDWDTYDNVNDWPVADDGGDYDSTKEDTTTVLGGSTAWYSWDVTDMVSGWMSGTYPNYGMIFEADSVGYYQYFYSSDYITDTSLVPKLIVNLTTTRMLDYTDGLSLYHSSDSLMDYVAWGGSPGSGDDDAVDASHWTAGDFINTSSISENQSFGRDRYCTDTNSSDDWEGPETNKADPFGIHSGSWTQGAVNLDQFILINEIMFKPDGNPYDNGWDHRKKITIHAGKVAGDLTDFPVVLDMTLSDLAHYAQSDGDDILFVGADNDTKLAHEIEIFNGTTGRLLVWIKIPYLSSTEDTTIYMYFGNSSTTNQQ
ncbi:MAG: DUF2341 domain-containing protein, partial [Methanomassiliicoccales archaeon]